MRALILIGCLFLSACTGFPQAAKDVADRAAQAEILVLCGMTVGAYYRLNNQKIQEGITLICSNTNTPLNSDRGP